MHPNISSAHFHPNIYIQDIFVVGHSVAVHFAAGRFAAGAGQFAAG
jgi:hypothetical protein